MQRFALGIEFCGTRFKGWQTQQAGVRSIQETIETVLSKIADEPIIVHGNPRPLAESIVGRCLLEAVSLPP